MCKVGDLTAEFAEMNEDAAVDEDQAAFDDKEPQVVVDETLRLVILVDPALERVSTV